MIVTDAPLKQPARRDGDPHLSRPMRMQFSSEQYESAAIDAGREASYDRVGCEKCDDFGENADSLLTRLNARSHSACPVALTRSISSIGGAARRGRISHCFASGSLNADLARNCG